MIDAVVFGVDDERWGEKVAACVEVNSSIGLTIEMIRAEFLKVASADMLPHEIKIANELPRGPAGKVIIKHARQLLDSSQTMDYEGDDDDLVNRIMVIAARVFGMPATSLSPESSRKNTGFWTSLAHVELILSIEKAFQLRMEPRDVMTIQTLQNVIDILRRRNASCRDEPPSPSNQGYPLRIV